MRLKSIFTVIMLALIASAAVLAVTLRGGLALGFATGYLETQLSNALGRKVFLEQAPYVQLKAGLHLAAGNIRLANADWSDKQPMLVLHALKIHIDPRTLLDEQIVIENFELDGLHLRLHTNADGHSNVPMPSKRGSKTDEQPQEPPLPVLVRRVKISDVHLSRRNDKTETQLELSIDALTQQEADKEALVLVGNGTFQGRPWNAKINGSKFSALRSGRNVYATVDGSLGELSLTGAFALPDARALQNLTAHAKLVGKIPPRIADLSPLLVAHEPARIDLSVSDVDPGLGVDLNVGLTLLDINLSGDIDHPLTGDGLDLAGTLTATSLPRLAKALNLGETADMPVSLKGRLRRNGRSFELQEAVLETGEHVLRADAVLPNILSTDGFVLKLQGQGPDFSLYQRLFGAPDNLVAPYTIDAEVTRNRQILREDLVGTLAIGDHELHIRAGLSNFPSYTGSDLEFRFETPSVQAIAATANVTVPDSALTIAGALAVTDNDVIQIQSLDFSAYELDGNIRGRLDSYPEFGHAALKANVTGDSLAAFGQQFGLKPLGAFPLNFAATLEGNPTRIVVRDPKLHVGGLDISSDKGELRYADKQLQSDITFKVSLSNINQLLNTYAPAYPRTDVGTGKYTFDLKPQLSPTKASLSLDNLKGPGLRGSARIDVNPAFRLDENSLIAADLAIDDPAVILPAIDGYTFPKGKLSVSALTRPQGDAAEIDMTLHNGKASLLTATITLPAAGAKESITLQVDGKGDDLRSLGSHTAFPAGPLPFDVSVNAAFKDSLVTVDVQRFALSGSQLTGQASWDGSQNSLVADIQVPKAALQPWLRDTSTVAAKKPSEKGSRLIPNTVLPLQYLHDYTLDIAVQTGALGLVDPWFTTESLIDSAQLHLRTGKGEGHLRIDKLQGSRGSHKGDIRIVDAATGSRAEGNINIDGMPLGVIAAGTSFDKLPTYSIDTTLSAQGRTPRELASTLSGDFLMTGSAGTLKKMRMSVATESFIAQLFRTLLPMLDTAQAAMQVECSVLTARAEGGVLTLDPGFVFRSAGVDLFAQGRIDLGNETLNIGFNNRARKGLGISAANVINPFVAITGTLAKPRLGLDIASSALSGSAAVATAGVTIIAKPLFDRFFSRRNPCDAALAQWNEASP